MARESIDYSNNIVAMIRGGSKGSNYNITQIMCCLGQVNVEGKRVGFGFSRTSPLHHFFIHSCLFSQEPNHAQPPHPPHLPSPPQAGRCLTSRRTTTAPSRAASSRTLTSRASPLRSSSSTPWGGERGSSTRRSRRRRWATSSDDSSSSWSPPWSDTTAGTRMPRGKMGRGARSLHAEIRRNADGEIEQG